MDHLTVTLNDNSTRTIAPGHPVIEALRDCKQINNAAAIMIDGRTCDLQTVLDRDARVEFIAVDSPEGLDILRHSTSHLMAHAVKSLFPKVQVAIGPSIGKVIAKALGIEKGILYDMFTSRVVGTALGVAISKSFGKKN